MDRLGHSVIDREPSSYLVTKHRRPVPLLRVTNRRNRMVRRGKPALLPLKNAIPSHAITTFPTSQQPNMSTQQLPSKSSLSITLTEPFVILRTVDTGGSEPALGEFAPPSVLRGLLALDLSKASKISSIQIELQGTSCASWSEGMSRARSSFEPL
jgi:hypothetical protein